MAAIETDALTKDYQVGFWRKRPYRALDGLSLRVEHGEVFGCLGPNGAGKSTTLKLLMGLIFPTSGAARILGRPVGDLEVRRQIGFLPENPTFYDHLTAEELLRYFAGLAGLPGALRDRRVSEALDEVGMAAERRRPLRSYSKGMIQRVGIAQALVNEPRVVFLDEPMSGLDPLGRRHVRELMLRLRARGCTIFFSSHILADAEALCSRVAILAQGRLVAEGRLSDLIALDVRGWELVVAHLPPAAAEAVGDRIAAITPLPDGRSALHVPPGERPEPLVQQLAAAGAVLVSLNPVRPTLEEYFVSKVGAAPPPDVSGPAS